MVKKLIIIMMIMMMIRIYWRDLKEFVYSTYMTESFYDI